MNILLIIFIQFIITIIIDIIFCYIIMKYLSSKLISKVLDYSFKNNDIDINNSEFDKFFESINVIDNDSSTDTGNLSNPTQF